MDYEKLCLAKKIGGVCDIDQVYILNTNDGPTMGQCGSLTGYSSMFTVKNRVLSLLIIYNFFPAVVAVKPNQEKPLKIAVIVQSEPTKYWLIKISQIGCTEIKRFKGRIQHNL